MLRIRLYGRSWTGY